MPAPRIRSLLHKRGKPLAGPRYSLPHSLSHSPPSGSLMQLFALTFASPAFAVLAIASAVIVYILIGYPLLLAFLCRRQGPAIQKDTTFRPTVTVILAVHNGAPFIARTLDCLLSLRYPVSLLQILVVSDGSTDRTDLIVRQYSFRGVRLISIPRSGKAA